MLLVLSSCTLQCRYRCSGCGTYGALPPEGHFGGRQTSKQSRFGAPITYSLYAVAAVPRNSLIASANASIDSASEWFVTRPESAGHMASMLIPRIILAYFDDRWSMIKAKYPKWFFRQKKYFGGVIKLFFGVFVNLGWDIYHRFELLDPIHNLSFESHTRPSNSSMVISHKFEKFSHGFVLRRNFDQFGI